MHTDSIDKLNPDGNPADMASANGMFVGVDKVLTWMLRYVWKGLIIALVVMFILTTVSYCKSYKAHKTTHKHLVERATATPLPTVPVPAVITPAPGPSSRWSDKETFPLERCEWSPRISPAKYEADKVPGREVRIDGNDSNIRPWPTSQENFDVESYVQFIEIRSTVVPKMTVYGKPKG